MLAPAMADPARVEIEDGEEVEGEEEVLEEVGVEEDGEEEEAETATVAAERRELARKRRRKNETDQLNSRKLTVGVHHGRMNVLPQQWTFSSMTSLQLVQNWFIGDVRRNIPPLCNLDSKNVIHLKGGNRTRNKMKSFMRIVEEEAREKDVWIADPSKWDYRAVTKRRELGPRAQSRRGESPILAVSSLFPLYF